MPIGEPVVNCGIWHNRHQDHHRPHRNFSRLNHKTFPNYRNGNTGPFMRASHRAVWHFGNREWQLTIRRLSDALQRMSDNGVVILAPTDTDRSPEPQETDARWRCHRCSHRGWKFHARNSIRYVRVKASSKQRDFRKHLKAERREKSGDNFAILLEFVVKLEIFCVDCALSESLRRYISAICLSAFAF